MKNRSFLLLVLTFLVLISSSQSFAKGEKRGKAGGWRESYGGDSTTSSFQNTAYDILTNLKISKKNSYFDLKLFEEKIRSTVLSCEKNLSLDGIKKDAINYPFQNPPKIALDCESWNAPTNIQSNRTRLVMHEYLHLMLIDDSDYSISSQITKAFYQAQQATIGDSTDLLAAALECNIPFYNSLIEKGANLYYIHENGLNALNFALMGGCAPVTKELIELLPILEDRYDDLQTKKLVHGNENVSIARLFVDASLEAQQTANDPSMPFLFLNTLEIVLKKYPQFITTKVDYDQECLKSSSLLSALARGFETRFPKARETKFNIPAIQKLVDIGFSLDEVDACGITPRYLLKKNNIEIKQ